MILYLLYKLVFVPAEFRCAAICWLICPLPAISWCLER